jgi:cytochrome c oxidase assembly protein subunit 19
MTMATNGCSDRNLMAKDEFKNLGFSDDKPAENTKRDDGADKGQKGELRW